MSDMINILINNQIKNKSEIEIRISYTLKKLPNILSYISDM